jgi:hypothetical protein
MALKIIKLRFWIEFGKLNASMKYYYKRGYGIEAGLIYRYGYIK